MKVEARSGRTNGGYKWECRCSRSGYIQGFSFYFGGDPVVLTWEQVNDIAGVVSGQERERIESERKRVGTDKDFMVEFLCQNIREDKFNKGGIEKREFFLTFWEYCSAHNVVYWKGLRLFEVMSSLNISLRGMRWEGIAWREKVEARESEDEDNYNLALAVLIGYNGNWTLKEIREQIGVSAYEITKLQDILKAKKLLSRNRKKPVSRMVTRKGRDVVKSLEKVNK